MTEPTSQAPSAPNQTGASRLPFLPYRQTAGLIFVSGQLAFKNGKVLEGGIEAQVECVIDLLEEVLQSCQRSLQDVVKTTVWLTHKDDFAAFNRIYATRFSEPYPARALTISQLALEGARVEIEAIATAA